MKKYTSPLKQAGIAAIGSLLLTAGASAGDNPVKEQAAAPQTTETTAENIKKDTKHAGKKKSRKKTGLEKKRPEKASGSK